MRSHILIVEDDQAIAQLIEMTLTISEHQTSLCQDGRDAYALLSQERYDLLILDVMLPGMDGFRLVERLREAGRSLPPVLFLTAKVEVADRVRGLRLGAEDYMLKPFHPLELQARVDGILRRHQGSREALQVGEVRLDRATRTVTRAGEALRLTPQEYALLEMLMLHKNMALSREQLLQAAWGYDYMGGTRTVDMHIQRLRRKLGWQEVIRTVFKLGYRLEAPP